MTPELYWLTLTSLMTGLFWIPYILNRMVEMGIFPAVFRPQPDSPKAAWAGRMVKAHRNAIENLAVFAPLALAVHLSGTGTSLTAAAAMIYFFTRLAHFICYTLAVPGLRTVTFIVGFACQMILGLTVLGVV